MAKSYEEVAGLKASLKDEYRVRHEDLKLLRDFYHGKFWDRAETESRGISQVFRDMTMKAKDVGPDVKVVHNILWEIVTKYQTFLSPVPQCRMYTDPPESTLRRAQAVKKERFVYGCWNQNRLPRKLSKVGWYVPLMGDCFLGIWPDFDTNIPKMLVRSPEYAFPIPNVEGDLAGVIFSWEMRESMALREFPKYTPQASRPKAGFLNRLTSQVVSKPNDPQVEVIEYSDSECFYRWVDGVQVAGIEHNLGFNLFDQVQFIHVPDEVWGHGAVEQYVGMNEMQNAMYSLVFQGMMDNIFPHLVLEDPSKAPELIERGPGAVLPLNPGGKAYYLAPPVQTLQVQEGFMNLNDHNIRRGTGQPGVNMGDSPASSVVTGKAVNELQGAATGATIEMVQGVGIGQALVSFNEKAVVMAQRLFANDQINLFGVLPQTHIELNPKQFALTLKGKELIGSPRNEVVFSPHLSDHDKLVMGLQGLGAGLWSKKYVREQMGVPDNEAMVEEIFSEMVDDGVLQTMIQAMQEPTPEAATQAEDKAFAFIEGGQAPHPLLAMGMGGGVTGPAGALPAGMPPAGMPPPGASGPGGPGGPPMQNRMPVGPIAGGGATGQVGAPALRLPPGSPAPAPAAGPPGAPPAPGGGQSVSLNDVASAFQSLKNIKGRVFLVGEIVDQGQTSADIEVALTADDRQAIADQLPQYANQFVFHHVDGEPTEAAVEVTPGRPVRAIKGAPAQP